MTINAVIDGSGNMKTIIFFFFDMYIQERRFELVTSAS
jgi:hypothetical protein